MCLPFCHKYKEEIKDGYQFCKECGRARKVSCNHKWELFKKIQVDTDLGGRYYKYILQCKNCGILKNKNS